MPRAKSLNFGKLNAELFAADSAIAPILVSAKILTLQVEGKDVSASDAPLPVKISALGSLISTGDKTQDSAELITANGQLAAHAEETEGKLTAALATSAAQSQKITELSGQLTTANASISTLTAKNSETTNLLEASTKESTRLTGNLNGVNRAVSVLCVAVNCLDLTGEDGKPLAKEAKDEDKLSAADKIPIADKLKAYSGALNAAAAKVGIQLSTIPAGGAAAPAQNAKKLSIDEEIRQRKAQEQARR